MVNFRVYTYQFGPIVPGPNSLPFPLECDPDEVMKRKNEIFEMLFADLDSLEIYPAKDSTIPLPIEAVHNKSIIMFKLGDPRPVTLIKKEGKRFQDKSDTTSPHCMIIIDNRHNEQRILIQSKRDVFNGNTDRIAAMLQFSFNRKLSKEHLYMEIGHEYPPVVFWNYIKSQPQGIKSIKLCIPFPNLPRVSDEVDNVDKVFEQMNNDYHSSMVIQIDAAEGGVLTGLDENDPRLQYFLAANAKCGRYALVKAAGRKSYYECGKKDHMSQQLDDRIAKMTANDFAGELWDTTYSYVADQIKDPGHPINL